MCSICVFVMVAAQVLAFSFLFCFQGSGHLCHVGICKCVHLYCHGVNTDLLFQVYFF